MAVLIDVRTGESCSEPHKIRLGQGAQLARHVPELSDISFRLHAARGNMDDSEQTD